MSKRKPTRIQKAAEQFGARGTGADGLHDFGRAHHDPFPVAYPGIPVSGVHRGLHLAGDGAHRVFGQGGEIRRGAHKRGRDPAARDTQAGQDAYKKDSARQSSVHRPVPFGP